MSVQVDLSTIPISPDGGKDASTSEPRTEEADTKITTVFHDAQNFNVKHPLANRWTLWFTKPSSGKVGSDLVGHHCWLNSNN